MNQHVPLPREIAPDQVHEVLGQHVLADGFKLVYDTRASRGSWLVDARSGEKYLDLYTFFASAPLGSNPRGLADDPTQFPEHGGPETPTGPPAGDPNNAGPPGGGGPVLAALSRDRQGPQVSAPGPGNQADSMMKVKSAVDSAKITSR